MSVRRFALAIAAGVLVLSGAALALPSPALAAHTTTIVNFDSNGNQVTRYDTAGNAVDAHDGDLALFGGVYYLYGTSYDCGYALNTNGTPFCGFKVYSSPDLVHWTDRGPLFDASTALWQGRCAPPRFGCYRPHVVRNAATGQYVLWVNGYDNPSGYRVLTSTDPAGPFTEVAEPTLAVQGTGAGFNNGDHDLFVDDDGTGYIAYTDIRGAGAGSHDQIIERLDATYTTGTGAYTRLGSTHTEAPSLFKRGGVYYYVYGPTCAYCTGTQTWYKRATAPLGTWTAPMSINANSCGGQPSFVAAIPTSTGTEYLYGSDLWNGQNNEALANFHWAPLSFAGDGSISPFACSNSVTLTLTTGAAGAQLVPADRDSTGGVDGYRTWCDISASLLRRTQSFVATRTGTLTSASYTTFQRGPVNAGLTISIVTASGSPLYTTTVPASDIGWAPRNVTISPDVAVTAGTRYGIRVTSATTTGCYGLTYNDAAPYPSGGESYSTDGVTWIPETNRTSKFETTIGATNLAGPAARSASSSAEASGWTLAAVNDGQRTSTPTSMGWSSNNNLGVNHAEWLQLDLGTARAVNRVDLFARSDAGNAGQGFPVTLRVEVSANGQTWAPALIRTGLAVPGTGAQRFTFGAQGARYIRVVGTSLRNTNPNDPTYRMQFAEIEVY
ncbi:family 43 glycosylhydrolase [Dactylosporangium siamense]|nr:family 43 glycosylhydrolase [Dactylosporangium siamense]